MARLPEMRPPPTTRPLHELLAIFGSPDEVAGVEGGYGRRLGKVVAEATMKKPLWRRTRRVTVCDLSVLEDAPASMTCPECGEQMKLARTVPGFGGHPELLSFRCENCGDVQTIEDDQERPG